MRLITEFLKKSMFHNYERGTWPYDVMVLVVLLATFLPPLFSESLRDRYRPGDDAVREIPGIRTIHIREGVTYVGFASSEGGEPGALEEAVRQYRDEYGEPGDVLIIRDRNGEAAGYLLFDHGQRPESAD
jgi:hypothetical protein